MSNGQKQMTKRFREFYKIKSILQHVVSPDDKRTYRQGFMDALEIMSKVLEGKVSEGKVLEDQISGVTYEDWFYKKDKTSPKG